MSIRALITGVTGQDGGYLADLMLEKGYTVFGMVRCSSAENFARIEHLREHIQLWLPKLDFHGLVETMVCADYDDLAAQGRNVLPEPALSARRQAARDLKLSKTRV